MNLTEPTPKTQATAWIRITYIGEGPLYRVEWDLPPDQQRDLLEVVELVNTPWEFGQGYEGPQLRGKRRIISDLEYFTDYCESNRSNILFSEAKLIVVGNG